MKKYTGIAAALPPLLILISCASVQAGLYNTFIEKADEQTILNNEPGVRLFLQGAADGGQYSVKVFARTELKYQVKRTKLMTHSYYVFFSANGEYHTVSYHGTKIWFYSRGAWKLDSAFDMESFREYAAGGKKYHVAELFADVSIDARQTARNILARMDSGRTYYYKDHINDKPGVDNCNTALWETLAEIRGGK